MDWFIRSRKKNCPNFFLSHSYFKMSKTLRLNVNYIILSKIPKNQLSQIYIDQPININKELFYKIVSELNKYENIIIDLKTPIEKFQIRKISMKYYVDIVYMIINGVIISKNKKIIEMKLKDIKGSGLSNVKKGSGLSNVKKGSGLSNVKKGSGLKILK